MNILIVGADRGIAHALSLQLQARGEQVFAACMADTAPYLGTGIEAIGGIDVTSAEAVNTLAEALRGREIKLDWLVQVAGILGLDELGSIDYDAMRHQFEVNTLGPLRVVEACLPHLSDGSKVGIVTSRVGSLADNGSGAMYGYRVSKAGANMVALNLHHDLKNRGISVLALHPGMVATDLTRNLPGDFTYIQPSEAARGLIARMDHLSPATSGQFRHANGERLQW